MCINVSTIIFDGNLRHGDEQMFRGAIVKLMGSQSSPLLHNHTGEGLRFSYPLVQYKIISGHPAIVGIGDGTELLNGLHGEYALAIGQQERLFSVMHTSTQQYSPQVGNAPHMYTLKRYIPLNRENATEYESLPALTDRICKLEAIINANVLSFFKGIGYHCDSALYTAISSIEKQENLYYKSVKFKGFDLTFISNAALPSHIGLGKSSSVGFGVLEAKEIPQRFAAALMG